ncbi:MAG: RecQ family ATP-dependent DNA helicase [Actinomycetes bacterium]|jgi:ATP-dependent DNA helicase RecQ|nr:RecQ family ATP-dependent DNA helicase [Actinomycetes bacterium]
MTTRTNIRDAQTALSHYFGYERFRDGQAALIEQLLAGRDVTGVMPTGAGKSLCYQIPALLTEGLTLVISPLISLMKDQVEALRSCGVAAAYLNSTLTLAEQRETLRTAANGKLRLLYIAPERLESTNFSEYVQTSKGHISLVAVDEAHCISQWGQDFRPSYLRIPSFIASLAQRPVVAAFTATATAQVRDDIVRTLDLHEPFVLTTGFDRPNLWFEVRRPGEKSGGAGGRGGRITDRKFAALLKFLREDERGNTQSGIVYCATRKTVEEVCSALCDAGFLATRYHAGLSEAERHRNQTDFLHDNRPLMVATNAFGMGIDKSNVNYVVHYNLPQNIESYYQEAGRAGRDGTPAVCLLLYTPGDVETCKFLITHTSDADNAGTGAGLDALTRQELEAKNLALLKQMVFYATTSECLRAFILRYFGESETEACGACSNCAEEFAERDVTVEAQKVVSCVYRLEQRGQRLGKVLVADVLRGSGSRRVRELGLDSLSTYGIMAGAGVAWVRALIDFLVEREYLNVSDSRYPVLSWGPRAREALEPGAQVIMKERVVAAAAAAAGSAAEVKGAYGDGSSAGGNGVEDAGSTSEARDSGTSGRRKSAETRRQLKAAARETLSGTDHVLFERLRVLRREIAEREGVPAFVVFSDATLYDMVAKRPTTETEFLQVSGVGATKLERYGKAFLIVLKER